MYLDSLQVLAPALQLAQEAADVMRWFVNLCVPAF